MHEPQIERFYLVRWRIALAMLLSGAISLLAVTYLLSRWAVMTPGSLARTSAVLVLFGWIYLVNACALVERRPFALVDDAGLLFRQLFSKPIYVRWRDVERAEVPPLQGMEGFLWLRLRHASPTARRYRVLWMPQWLGGPTMSLPVKLLGPTFKATIEKRVSEARAHTCP